MSVDTETTESNTPSSAAAILTAGESKASVPAAGGTDPETPPMKGNGSTLMVKDLTATADNPSRTHELIIGGRIEKFIFAYGEYLVLPFNTAIRFSQNPGFVVEHKDGRSFEAPPSDVDERSETPKIELADDEVIARFDELTKPALVLRAQLLPGGEDITDRIGKGDVIEFLKQERLAAKKANSVSDGDMSQDDLDNLFEGRTEDDE